ncbi:MAG: tetratricopeptide repeat protein, partial [Marinicellaceae bacterium]
ISGLTIYTTASDLYQWEKALWNNTLVNIDALKKVILEKGLSGNNLRAFFDFGNFKLNEKGELTDVMHDGSHPSHHAYKSINFTKDLIIILMSSDGRKSTLYELHEGLSNISHNSPVILPASWWLSHQIKTEGIDVALEAYKSKLTIDNDLNSNEQTLNNLGYGLYANKQLEEALKVMKLNLELYPNSANTYDSYAELLIDANKQAEALPFIKQGIKVATENKNGQLLTILKSKLIKYNDEVNK